MLHYRTLEGHPGRDWVVFVHGAGGSSAVWFKQVRSFQDVFNVLLVDLRGHGKSSTSTRQKGDYSINALSQDVVDVLDHVGIRRAHFIGVSLGTIIVRCIGDIAPDRVSSMVMAGAVTRLNAWAQFLVHSGHFLKHLLPFRTLYRMLAWIIMPGPRAREAREVFGREARKVAPDEFRRWMRLTREVNERLRVWALAATHCPVLYVMGGHDYMFLPSTRHLVARYQNAFLEVLHGAGHVCNVEKPEAFNRSAIAFLSIPVSVSPHIPVPPQIGSN